MFAKLNGWPRVLLGLVLFKGAYLGLLCAALGLFPDFDETRQSGTQATWLPRAQERHPEGFGPFARHFATWDAAHYLLLSEAGYAQGMRSCAFYPLWPTLVRGLAVFTGGNHLISGMMLANLLSLAGWTLFYTVAAGRFGEATARRALVLLIAFPGSLFYQFIYTEALFFLLVMVLWRGLERERYGGAWVAAFLLPLTRAVGVFCVLPIAWAWLSRMRNAQRGTRNGGGIGSILHSLSSLFHSPSSLLQPTPPALTDGTRCPTNAARGCALLAAPLLGLMTYFILMWSWTGNPFEGMEAQKYWGAHAIRHLWDVPRFVVGFFEPTHWHAFRGSVLDRVLFLLLLYSLPLIWRQGKDLVVWTYVLGILPAMSGTFVSFTRFEATVFPLFLALAAFPVARKPRGLFPVLVGALAILHLVLLWRFVNYRWAG